MIVDAHHHVWDPGARPHLWLAGYPALRRPFPIGEFTRLSSAHGVSASVLVQVLASRSETEEFLAIAAAGGPVAGVVGWVDLTAPDAAAQIARLRELPGGDRLVGVRHLVQDEPDPEWLRRPDVRRGLRAAGEAGLACDLLVRPAQLPAAVRTTGELSEVRFILDHGGKPAIAEGGFEPWASLIAELAARPHVACKLSGLVTEAGPGWSPGQIAPYADQLLGCFGPDRLIFGSDWPVCTLAASYGQVLALARELLAARLGPAGTAAVLAGNAITWYGLRLPPASS